MFLEKTILGAILKMNFFKNQFWKCIFLRVPSVNWLTVFGEGSELKNWMDEQPVKCNGCSKYQFLEEVFWSQKFQKGFMKFFGERKLHFLK